ncbi:MAG: OsmC family protein [Alphaproteobacteria bacterium]|nr:OsmC family protein [Alphaproteobacteria bacterium]MCB9928943.1 OsmC family protein [Alphaproteobacteria bacterium]
MSDLKSIIANMQANLRVRPDSAKATFQSQSRLQDGLRTVAKIRQHEVTVDEPPALGGEDAGPNPVELILAALGTCQEITYRAYATALGIPLENVSVTLAGDLDLRGFFGVDDSVRAGYQRITGTVRLESSADEETLLALRQAVNAHCPVLDIIRQPVPVTLELDIKSPG